MWTVWRERNSRTFEDVMKSTDQLLGSFVESLFDWSRAGGFTTTNTVHDLLLYCILILLIFLCCNAVFSGAQFVHSELF